MYIQCVTDYLPCTVLVAISLVGFPSSDKLIIVLYVTPKFPRKQKNNKIIYKWEYCIFHQHIKWICFMAYALYDRQMDAKVNPLKYRNVLQLEFTHIWDTTSHKQTNHPTVWWLRYTPPLISLLGGILQYDIYSSESVKALVSFIVQW